MISGGLPGLMTALLSSDEAHPLVRAADMARQILQLDTFSRLALVDSLSKQRSFCDDICFILQQMATVMLRDASKAKSHRHWLTIMKEAAEAQQALATNATPRLVLTKLMLAL